MVGAQLLPSGVDELAVSRRFRELGLAFKDPIDLPMMGRFILPSDSEVGMNIGQLAKSSGVNAKLIRHYESIGLIPKAARTDSGYRIYTESDVHTLRFLKRARHLGFPMKDVKQLIGLWKNRGRRSGDVKRVAQEHLDALELKISELESMSKAIRHLIHNCHGDGRPDCPILDDLGKV